jgi:ribonuclease PH
MRLNNRPNNEIRPISFELGFLKHHKSSVLMSLGETKVLAVVSSENRVPAHRYEIGGWLSAEYNMMPGATFPRKPRAISKLRNDGRSVEISRLIGRSLRQAVDINAIGPRTLSIDCDVISADAGTRSACITAGYMALVLHVAELLKSNQIKMKTMEDIILRPVAAVSLGVINDQILCDLDYQEDFKADTDCNLVASNNNQIIEFQSTAEQKPLNQNLLVEMLGVGQHAITQLLDLQKKTLLKAGIVLHH